MSHFALVLAGVCAELQGVQTTLYDIHKICYKYTDDILSVSRFALKLAGVCAELQDVQTALLTRLLALAPYGGLARRMSKWQMLSSSAFRCVTVCNTACDLHTICQKSEVLADEHGWSSILGAAHHLEE